MPAPKRPKICHILHHDKIPSVVRDNFLYSDTIITKTAPNGTTIGMSSIKLRCLEECELTSHPGLFVGQCVPFYFCPRSVMLFLIHRRNFELEYKGGQSPIVHLVADLQELTWRLSATIEVMKVLKRRGLSYKTIKWAEDNNKRWAFTSSNAGSFYFEDFCALSQLDKINWDAVNEKYWSSCREEKQAEFLIEDCFPWELVERIGVISTEYDRIVNKKLIAATHKPKIQVQPNWYY